jgi:hypothetical protein
MRANDGGTNLDRKPKPAPPLFVPSMEWLDIEFLHARLSAKPWQRIGNFMPVSFVSDKVVLVWAQREIGPYDPSRNAIDARHALILSEHVSATILAEMTLPIWRWTKDAK